MVLIFTNENDISSFQVAKWLDHFNVETILINPENQVWKFHLINKEGIYFKNVVTQQVKNVENATACWWRRTGISYNNFLYQPFLSPFIIDGIDLSEVITGNKSIIKDETLELRDYIFNRIYQKCPINLGAPDKYNLNKLLVLDIAQKHGLKTPGYEIISNTRQLSNSHHLHEETVTKAIRNGIYHQIGHQSFYTYTEKINKEHFADKDIALFPTLAMNMISKKYEIRSFFLEGQFYSMAIFSQSNEQTRVDFRKYSSVTPNKNEPFQLPAPIEEKLRRVFEELALNTGSVDLIIDENNEYYFLEINPVGQYGMTSDPCNYDLDYIIAKYLINGKLH